MSGVGKSTLVRELRRRGHSAFDADDADFTEPRADGRWGWRTDQVTELFETGPDPLFFAGCSEEQAALPFNLRVLLTAPADVVLPRRAERTTNGYGRSEAERAQVIADLQEIEPLLRRSADLVLSATEPTAALADAVLGLTAAAGRRGS